MRTDALHFPRAPVTEPDNVAVLPAGLPGDVMFAQDFAIAGQVAAAPAVAFAEMPDGPLTGASGGAGIIAEPTPRLAAPGRPPRPAPVWPLTVASRPAAASGPSMEPFPVAGRGDPVAIAPPATSPAGGERAERSATPTPSTPDAPSPAARWDKAGRADNRAGLTALQ